MSKHKLEVLDWFFAKRPEDSIEDAILCEVFNDGGEWRAEVINAGWNYRIDREGNCNYKAKNKPGFGYKLIMVCPKDLKFGRSSYLGAKRFDEGMEQAKDWLVDQLKEKA